MDRWSFTKMKTIIYNIGTLAGILPEGVLKLEGAQMNEVECLKNAYLVIEDGIISDFGVEVGGSRGIQNRATPLAAGGGARSEGVGGVVLHTTPSDASSRINVTDNSALGLPRAEIRMACSKGTYVRAFARDLGEALGSGAHLDSLQRSRSGIFHIENALSVEQTINLLKAE